LQSWLLGARLDSFSAMIAQATRQAAPDHMAVLERYRDAVQPGLARLGELLQSAA
jgi:hypothetical protein